ncbi:hypothetical protein AALP_AA6G060100 [Arabis alpina]|uniref:Pentacotripeptide-repeat region of PRORP domain-containing protein n=1 Tax=Arabis alpina TaxID=50452 RepID=A0A087GMD8_ARAAL|nr:hypothetical protein AALP_AA6G060100 [Arabis alpina]
MRHLIKHLVQQTRAFNTISCVRHPGNLISPLRNNALQLRIATALDQKKPIVQVLEQWQDQGNQVKPSDLRCMIKKLQDSDRFYHALQISEWMSSQKVYNLFPEDIASRIQLMETVLGLREAEKLFESIPETLKDYTVYETLLTFYTRSEETLHKAEATFEKMRELGFLLKPSPYNLMLSLYSPLRNQEMVNELLIEMEENNLQPDDLTGNYALSMYAAVSDIKGMEKFLTRNPGIRLEWGTCIDMAKAYLKTCSMEKALAMLHRTEQLVDSASRKSAYETLMMLYGDVGEREEVYRVWELHKNTEIGSLEVFRSMPASLIL